MNTQAKSGRLPTRIPGTHLAPEGKRRMRSVGRAPVPDVVSGWSSDLWTVARLLAALRRLPAERSDAGEEEPWRKR